VPFRQQDYRSIRLGDRCLENRIADLGTEDFNLRYDGGKK
jgi:hypothetical protein